MKTTFSIISKRERLFIISALVKPVLRELHSTKYLFPTAINKAPTETSILVPKFLFLMVKALRDIMKAKMFLETTLQTKEILTLPITISNTPTGFTIFLVSVE